MATTVIALGSNLGDRRRHMAHALQFLSTLGSAPPAASSLYETEPVGDASTQPYLNAVCVLETKMDAMSLLEALKDYEREYGRDPSAPRWSNRTIDLDIIDYDRQIVARQRLHVPHPEYHTRLFVLVPLQEILPGWRDVRTGDPVDVLIANSPEIEVLKTTLKW